MHNEFIINKKIITHSSTHISSLCIFNSLTHAHILNYSLSELPQTLQTACKKRKAEFLAGRYVSQIGLQHFNSKNINILRGKKNNPIFPKPFTGSITHSKNIAIAEIILNDNELLGIDLELLLNLKRIQSIEHKILSQQEIHIIKKHISKLSDTYHLDHGFQLKLYQYFFTASFSAKESFYKAAFPIVQSYFGFNALTLMHIEDTTELIFTISKAFDIKCVRSNKLKQGVTIKAQINILQPPKLKFITDTLSNTINNEIYIYTRIKF